jgi:hypothetical protein
MKKCPFCAEEILDEAKVCKHCKKNIVEAEKPFYYKNIGCAPVLGIVFVIAGFFFWPLWILAALLFILAAVKK